jgi:hypothetical protein
MLRPTLLFHRLGQVFPRRRPLSLSFLLALHPPLSLSSFVVARPLSTNPFSSRSSPIVAPTTTAQVLRRRHQRRREGWTEGASPMPSRADIFHNDREWRTDGDDGAARPGPARPACYSRYPRNAAETPRDEMSFSQIWAFHLV